MRTTTLFPLLIATVSLTAGCKKKAAEPAAPLVGWHAEEGWVGECYFPPAFDALGRGDRRVARSQAMDAIMGQWRGDRADGVAFPSKAVTDVETAMLSYPDKMESVIAQNLAQCRTAMQGGGTTAWERWLVGVPTTLNAGECMRPLDQTVFWYLDIGMGWQGNAGVCEGEPIRIFASANDEFVVDDGQEWINAAGDADKPASGGEYPCTLEGCTVGQLVLRFRGDSGAELIQPIGLETVFTPPEHGVIEFTVNDTSYFNNTWRVVGGVQHRTSVTYEPVGR